MINKLEIDLELLQKTDNWASVMRELEQVIIKLENQTILGKRIIGITKFPILTIKATND